MIVIKLLIIMAIAQLWRMGGSDKFRWAGYRDVLIPIILGVYAGLNYWSILLAVLTIGSFNIIRMGYGAYDPEHDNKPSFLAKLTHDRQGWVNRGIAGAFYGIIGCIPLIEYLLFNDLLTYNLFLKWGGYILLNFSLGAGLCALKAKDEVIERIIGAGVGTFLLMF